MSVLTDNIERILEEKGIQRKQFFEDVGVSSVSFYKWKNGSFQPQMSRLEKIADYLSVSMSDLLKEKKTATQPSDGELSQSAKELISILPDLDEPSIRFLLKKAQEVAEIQRFRDLQE